MQHKTVPALEKCFSLLNLLSRSKDPLRISDIAKELEYNQSTVFNMVYTLVDLGVLEKRDKGRFHLGPQLYVLSRAAIRNSDLINVIHPFLEEISRQTRLMAILGIRSDLRAVILDKVDAISEIQIAAEVGMRIPLLAGAGGKALLTQLPEEELDEILAIEELRPYTPNSVTDKAEFRRMILESRARGFAVDREEYIEGARALAAPLYLNGRGMEAAIWIVGLKDKIRDDRIEAYADLLMRAAKEIETRLTLP